MRLKTALALTAFLGTGTALAQPPGFGRPRSPTVSPYLNLLNRDNSAAFNYYQLYRPQREFRQAYQGLNQELYQVERDVSRQTQEIEQRLATVEERVRPGAMLGTTGHPTSFMTYGKYFPAR